ncbi:transglycosylase SLT domain-containing protein [Streptomyces sp. NBC_00006]|uniref:transglycosylase SLT domain-containing protein n=1 Tax=unclassified Streptomyces TaxID=2593676 RepID=UPI0022582AC5|nr:MULTISPECIES: transglycosylase SLT domain-containing protein [unclassified Streptomyces]MCX4833425.1 transglycosylase SLT domain-containing protein [Streptomyces sp. NBC_01016]MCX5534406.1 transglycosylase SLT domain-containing protein [Streptomyces sp. NBC_00006]
MSKHANAGHSQLTRTHKFSLAGVAALGAAALAVTLVPGQDTQAQAKDETVAAAPVAFTTDAGAKQIKDVHASVTDQQAAASEKAKQAEAKAKARKEAEAKKKAEAEKKAQAEAKAKAEAQAKKEREAKQAAARAAARKPVYANNLDGWIKESLAIMKDKGIPGSYDGLHRNIMRESGGNPNAVNGTDVNAQNGTPSKGLLQVIQPTFDTYHVDGTANSLTDPVANLVAAANYAADKYGSIDNVDSAY